MNLERRQLLFGGAFLGLASTLPSEAQACTRAMESPFSSSFWSRRINRTFLAPRFERAAAFGLAEGVLERSRAKLDRLLAPDLEMSTLAGMTMARSVALDYLATYVNQLGGQTYQVNYFAPLIDHYEFLLDVTLSGSGPYAPDAGRHSGGALLALNTWGPCGGWIGEAWKRRVVFKITVDDFNPNAPQDLQIKTIGWLR